MAETYYDVLEVDPDATREEIRAAYRERVLETHPDHNDAPDAAEQFKRVSTAKSVLTDGAERARYDRLGHDAYVSLAERSAGGDDADTSNDSSPSTSDDSNGDPTADANATGTGSASRTRTGTASGRRRAEDANRSESRDGRTESHHARQRKRRRRQRTRQRAAADWSFGPGETAGATSRGDPAASDDDPDRSEFRYAVHDWTDDVDLEWEDRPLEYSTAVTIGCCWLLYPILVAASLTSAFPIAVNAIVAASTLGVIGYVLTRPRIAAGVFGSWSVLFPLGIDWLAPLSELSITGLVALGFAWIPFGYALALWWALRP